MRARLPRLTFLVRFTLLTLAVSTGSAFVLAQTMEISHRHAVEQDIVVAAVSRLSAELTAPLDALAAAGRLTPAVAHDMARIVDDAKLFEYVTGVRIYRPSGIPVYPVGAPIERDEVHLALASDNFVTQRRADGLSAFTPYYTRNEQAYVIALDFARAQFAAEAGRERNQIFSVVFAVSAIGFCALVSLAFGASRELERRRREAQSTFVRTLTIIADVIDLRDAYTAGHSQRVARYAKTLAIAIGLPAREVEVIESGALLHDIGKIGIPDRVLHKPGPLDADERRIMNEHPVIGARLIGGIAAMDEIVPCVLHHHEKFDGTGYPGRIAGQTIPLRARIISVADTFDAMTTDRPYRAALSAAFARDELVRVSGTQLDAALVTAFAALIDRGEICPPPSRAVLERAAHDAHDDLPCDAMPDGPPSTTGAAILR